MGDPKRSPLKIIGPTAEKHYREAVWKELSRVDWSLNYHHQYTTSTESSRAFSRPMLQSAIPEDAAVLQVADPHVLTY